MQFVTFVKAPSCLKVRLARLVGLSTVPYAYGANTVTGTPITVTVQVALEVVDGTVRV